MSFARPMSLGRRRAAMLLVLGAALSCANQDGRDVYALFRAYEHPDGLYQFRYLAPPWVFLERAPDGRRQLLAVEPSGDAPDAELEQAPVEARMKLLVETFEETTVEALVAEDVDRWRADGASPGAVEIFDSEEGTAGVKIDVEFEDRSMISLYHALAERRAVIMRIVSRDRLDTFDIRILLKGLEPLDREDGVDNE